MTDPNTSPSPQAALRPRRVFLRIPSKLPVKIFLEGSFYKQVYLADLSTNGLSFFVDASETVPDMLDMQLRFSWFSRTMKLKVQVRNRTALPEGVRVGCSFSSISDRDQEYINRYIFDFVGLGFSFGMVNSAAFICVLDASWRIVAYAVNSYYNLTEFGKSFQVQSPSSLYFGVLVLYAAFATAAFLFSTGVSGHRQKTFFLCSVLFLIPTFVFMLIKNAAYWQLGVWHSDYFFINAFFWIQVFAVVFVGTSIITAFTSLNKIDLIFDIIKQHRSYLQQ